MSTWPTPPRRIKRPRQLHGVRSLQEYKLAAIMFGDANDLFAQLWEPEIRPRAYVSHGEWKCDCPCGNWPIADPDWGVAICFQCGALYRPTFPPNVAEIEAILLKRPSTANQNWLPEETALELEAENIVHGV